MKRYWLFYGWYDDHDWPGSNGGLSDFYGSFDSIEGAYVDFAMAKNYYNEPACWCQILDSETNEIVKLQGYGETDRDLPHLRKHFKCPEIETQSPDPVSEWIDAEIYQSKIRTQKDDIPGEWLKPLPEDQKTIDGIRYHPTPEQIEFIPDDCACPSCGQNLHTKAYVYSGLFGYAKQTICVDCDLKLISWFHPKRGYIWISDIKAMEGMFVPSNGQKPIRSKFSLRGFVSTLFNKYL